MIPRIIHYCWYGSAIENNPMAMKCLKSWSKINNCQIIQWNEQNCLFNENEFVRTANREKKYAFISDYYRLKALYEYGGIYLDTDIEIKKPLPNKFFQQKVVLGFMFDNLVSTAFIMAEKESPLIKKLLHFYEQNMVRTDVGNNELFTSFLKETYPNFLLIGKEQELEPGVFIYPKEYFECLTISNKGGYAVHHFMASWRKKDQTTLRARLTKWIRKNIPFGDLVYHKLGRYMGYRHNRFYQQSLIDRKNIKYKK